MRLKVKRALELALCRSGLVHLATRLHRNDVLVLAYHNVIPDGMEILGDRSLHIGQEELHRQLSALSRTHTFISIAQVSRQGSGRARIAVTFDDAYRGAMELGGEVLADLNIPATVFVSPSCLGRQRFWWDVLSHEHELGRADREFALSDLGGRTSQVLEWAGVAHDPADVPAHYLSATEAELGSALAFDGLTLGSHSWSHPNLTALDRPELADELEQPRLWLMERFRERFVDWLSYPYGCWSSDVARAAHRAGYEGAFRIEGGRIREGFDRFALPRANVPAGLTLEGLRLRGAGLVSL